MVIEEGHNHRRDSDPKEDDYLHRKLAERMTLQGTRIDVASVSKKIRREAVSTRTTSKKLITTSDTFKVSSPDPRSQSKQQLLLHLLSSTNMNFDTPSSPPKTPTCLTPQMMLDQLQTIQTQERVRFSKRRESLLHDTQAIKLPPSPVDDDAPTPTVQSLSHDISLPPSPTDDNNYTTTPADPPTSSADDDEAHASATPNPYAECTPAELVLGKVKFSNAILEFNEILEGLGGIVFRQQQLVTDSPLNSELLSLQERLSRVQSIAVTEHTLLAEESQARAREADLQLKRQEQGVIIRASLGPDSLRPTDPASGISRVLEDTTSETVIGTVLGERSFSSPSSRVSGNGMFGSPKMDVR